MNRAGRRVVRHNYKIYGLVGTTQLMQMAKKMLKAKHKNKPIKKIKHEKKQMKMKVRDT